VIMNIIIVIIIITVIIIVEFCMTESSADNYKMFL
jgi:hypothetical protein